MANTSAFNVDLTSDVSTNIYMISGQHLLDSLCTLIFAYTTVDGELTLRGG